MATIAENIQTLKSIKSDIKNAIIQKGGSVTDAFGTYAQAITDLPSGGGGYDEQLIDIIEGDITTLNIPEGTTKIGDYAFDEYSSITDVTIPNSVKSIGNYAFQNCKGLTIFTIPDSVTSIGNSAFSFCSKLTSVTIPNSVTSIGTYVFNGCRSLTSVTIKATTPPTLGSNVFNNTNNCPIYVPAESVDAYKTATNWSTYANRIQAIPTV